MIRLQQLRRFSLFPSLVAAFVLLAASLLSAQTVTDPSTGEQYQLVVKSCNWIKAADSAEKLGGHLAVITSLQEQEFIYNSLGPYAHGEQFFIGATDSLVEGSFQWIT